MFIFISAALTSHLVSFGDQSSPGGAGGGPLGNRKTPEDSPYLVMSPVDPEAKDFSLSRRSTPPVKQRTASIDSTSGSGSGKFNYKKSRPTNLGHISTFLQEITSIKKLQLFGSHFLKVR